MVRETGGVKECKAILIIYISDKSILLLICYCTLIYSLENLLFIKRASSELFIEY